MLRERTAWAIALLHSASGNVDPSVKASFRCIDPSEIQRLRELLVSSGYLDPCGNLLRPLHHISLYEILSVVDEGIYPVHPDDDINELPTPYRNCKRGMYQTMIRELLCHMKLSEL